MQYQRYNYCPFRLLCSCFLFSLWLFLQVHIDFFFLGESMIITTRQGRFDRQRFRTEWKKKPIFLETLKVNGAARILRFNAQFFSNWTSWSLLLRSKFDLALFWCCSDLIHPNLRHLLIFILFLSSRIFCETLYSITAILMRSQRFHSLQNFLQLHTHSSAAWKNATNHIHSISLAMRTNICVCELLPTCSQY